MYISKILISIIVICFAHLNAQNNLIINAYNRYSFELNGEWKYIVDQYETGFYNYRYEPFDKLPNPKSGAYYLNSKPNGESDLIEYDFDKSDNIHVPGDWNTQKEKLYYYEGSIWYKKSFDYNKSNPSNRLFLYFEAINYKADVYLNGKKLGSHIGGFTPFNFEVTHNVNPTDNFLIVKVDNTRKRDGVPTLNTDWWNYGGITRDVKIIETPETFIQDYFIQLDPLNNKQINCKIKLNGSSVDQRNIKIIIPDLNLEKVVVTNHNGIAETQLQSDDINYWSTDNPHLYKVIMKSGNEEVADQIGFRTIRTEGQSILLNDKKIFLRGISIHEESPIHDGRAYSLEDAKSLLDYAKELGCNFVRLAHYPHNEHMVRLADEMGILVWEEIPVYWTILWENEETFQNAKNQLTELINRDKNRASVIIWSVANETPSGKARNLFLTNLADHARKLDPTRLISAALEQKTLDGNSSVKTIDDPFADVVDILSFNQYIGWYDGLPDKCQYITWEISQNKPVLISEFGAGAKYGVHGDSLTRWSEEYQEYLYKETLKMVMKIPQLQGFTPWILFDFRSPRRNLAGIQDGYNRKGLFSDKVEKKKAFYVLQKFYRDLISK